MFKFVLIFFLSFSYLFGQNLTPYQNIPKSELHLHIGGSWPLSYLKSICKSEEYSDLCVMLEDIEQTRVDYHGVFKIFQLIGKIMNTEKKIEDGVEALCRDLSEDNVVYAEFRTGLKDLGNGLEGYLKAVLRGIEKGTTAERVKVGLILSLRRDTPLPIARKTIDLALKYRSQGVIGLDLSGDSTQGDAKHLLSLFQEAHEQGLPITLHIGESQEESAVQQVRELQALQPERIGHGVHLCEEAQQWIKEKKILVELCLTSAIKAGMIKEAGEHPGLQLLLEGHPVAICTDDTLLFNTTLSKEYAKVAELTGLDHEDLNAMMEANKIYHFTGQSLQPLQCSAP